MTSLRWTALLPLAVLGACTAPSTEDHVRGVAVASRHVVVTGTTTSESGSCIHSNVTTTGGLLLVSSDDGRSFGRYEIADAAIGAIATFDGDFYLLVLRAGGYTVDASTDGVHWTARASGTEVAHDLTVDATGLHVAHEAGIRSSADGLTWTAQSVGGAGLYAPSLTRVGGRFVLATGDGALSTSTDGASWAPRMIATLTSVHRLATAGDHAIAIAHADRGEGSGTFAVAFDPATDAPATFAPIDDDVMAIVDAPAGVLLGDGTLAPGGELAARTAHTGAFAAGAVDGQRVVLAGDDGLAISDDGGATFAAPVALPLAY